MLALGLLLEGLLVRGPIRVAGLYVGVHFLALGALLALVGFNIINLGVLAKTLMSQRYSGLRSRTVALVRHRFSLEAGLLTGLVLIVAGTAIDIAIATQWVTRYGVPMDSSVHLAFVATTAVVLGLNLICSSFLLNMILADAPGHAE
jgi:uncharacterized membrane protein